MAGDLDWRSLPNGKKKRQAYYASRDWSLKKRAVRDRAGNKCERCGSNDGCQVHHQTYEHLYDEPLDDLQYICEECHKYKHGEVEEDPAKPAVETEQVDIFMLETGPLRAYSLRWLMEWEPDPTYEEYLNAVYPKAAMVDKKWYQTVIPQDTGDDMMEPALVAICQFTAGPAVFINDTPLTGFTTFKITTTIERDQVIKCVAVRVADF
jgi:hypothetical protein